MLKFHYPQNETKEEKTMLLVAIQTINFSLPLLLFREDPQGGCKRVSQDAHRKKCP